MTQELTLMKGGVRLREVVTQGGGDKGSVVTLGSGDEGSVVTLGSGEVVTKGNGDFGKW